VLLFGAAFAAILVRNLGDETSDSRLRVRLGVAGRLSCCGAHWQATTGTVTTSGCQPQAGDSESERIPLDDRIRIRTIPATWAPRHWQESLSGTLADSESDADSGVAAASRDSSLGLGVLRPHTRCQWQAGSRSSMRREVPQCMVPMEQDVPSLPWGYRRRLSRGSLRPRGPRLVHWDRDTHLVV